MKTADRSILFVFLVLAAAALGACDRASESGDEEPTVASADAESESTERSGGSGTDALQCPAEAEVVAAVGVPVQSKPYGSGCYYETADFDASVTILRVSASQADQLEREMREAATPYGAAGEAIEVGERGHAWGSPGYGQGYAVSGDHAYMLDVVTGSGDDQRAAVIQILEMMIG